MNTEPSKKIIVIVCFNVVVMLIGFIIIVIWG